MDFGRVSMVEFGPRRQNCLHVGTVTGPRCNSNRVILGFTLDPMDAGHPNPTGI
jgi:hypothetical protein